MTYAERRDAKKKADAAKLEEDLAAPADFAAGAGHALTEEEKEVIERKGTDAANPNTNPDPNPNLNPNPNTNTNTNPNPTPRYRGGAHGQIRQVLPHDRVLRMPQVRRSHLLVPGQV